MNRLIVLVVLGLLAMLFLGCNEQPEQSTSSDPVVAGANGEGPPAEPAHETAVADAQATEVEEPPVKTTADKLPPEPAEDKPAGLVGEWFALFGTHDDGVVLEPWKTGHRFTFSPDGTGRLVKFEGDQPTESLFVKWDMGEKELFIQFIASDAVELGFSQVAPMGIARDEEAGLLPLGVARDEETGLLSGNASEATAAGQGEYRRCMLKATLDDNYLALQDQYHRLMIYGRVPAGGDGEMPDLSGDWVGHIDMHDNFNAQFEIQDDGMVTGTYDHDGGKFVGRLFNGYLVGKVDYGLKFSLAALYPDEEWELDGVYIAPPFNQMVERYDFNRFAK